MSHLTKPESALIDAVRRAARQEQFLEVVSADDATQRFRRHLDLSPRGVDSVSLAGALGRVLAHDIAAPIDVPPFDRSGVDGFAVRASDTTGASESAPRIPDQERNTAPRQLDIRRAIHFGAWRTANTHANRTAITVRLTSTA